MQKKKTKTWLVALALVLSHCSTIPVDQQGTSSVEAVKIDHSIGKEIAESFEVHSTLKKDLELSLFAQSVALHLMEGTDQLSDVAVSVQFFIDQDVLWKNYGMPGVHIYLSIGTLKMLEFENEFAALIAIELAHVLKQHLAKRLAQGEAEGSESRIGWVPSVFGPSSKYKNEKELFNYTDDEVLESVEAAEGILYRGGIDPRGILTLFEKYRKSPHSPYSKVLLLKMVEKARTAIAFHPPLRNPVVRSDEFYAAMKRIRSL